MSGELHPGPVAERTDGVSRREAMIQLLRMGFAGSAAAGAVFTAAAPAANAPTNPRRLKPSLASVILSSSAFICQVTAHSLYGSSGSPFLL